MLLALPAHRPSARATLKMYQPQVLVGKVVACFVRLLVLMGLHRLLPRISLTIHADGPLATLVSDHNRMGCLLGNPEAHTRRALVLHEHEGHYLVDKIGVDEKSNRAVLAELDAIKMLPDGLTGIPALHGENLGNAWSSYATRFVDGVSPGKDDDERVLGLLGDWMKDARSAPLSESRQWKEMVDFADTHEVENVWSVIQKAATERILLGVFHGDFAPWNIKLSENGRSVVLDWETGTNEGPSGWDWLHYMIQRSSLVDGISAIEILKLCRNWAKSEIGKNFLGEAGWCEKTELWIGTYLAYSAWAMGFDRNELLAAWMESCQSQ